VVKNDLLIIQYQILRFIVQLFQYLASKEISQARFAKQIGVSQPTLSRYVNGDSIPSVVVGARIAEITQNLVSVNDWKNLHKDMLEEVISG
jgi:transcriptional regulator with XRE-family HTH domain